VTARALEFVEEKEHGFQEKVGERGTGLSAGQRQRIAIARALLANPDILILDDATSALDARTERAVIEGIHTAFSGRTVLIVSQKINPLLGTDRILLLEGGTVAAQGSHAQLARCSDTYRRICRTQGVEPPGRSQ
jgi:ABC-type multidrug transport system fused ATPase/permease subunit